VGAGRTGGAVRLSPKADRPGCPSHNGRHDTVSAYRYGCRCGMAMEAQRLYRKRRRYNLQPPGYVDGTGTRRRVQALAAIGWPAHSLATEMGLADGKSVRQLGHGHKVTRPVAAHVSRLYERLSMTPGPSAISRRRAEAAGWAPPLAWEGRDIDDPKARPARGATPGREPDEISIEHVCAGFHPVESLRPADRRIAVQRLTERHLRVNQIAERIGATGRTVDRLRHPGTAS
jgi:hypothetical protein